MPLYVSDYDAATNWCDLETDGLYMRVLRLLWSTPTQSIPDDDKWIIRKLRINTDQYKTFLIIKEEFLSVDDGRITQKRLSDEFEKAEELHNMRVSNGSMGGKAKALKTNEKSYSQAIAKLKPSSSQALASTSTVTNTNNSKKTKAKKATSLKQDWVLPEDYRQFVKDDKLSQDDNAISRVAENFKDHWLSNGKTFKDWKAVWRKWCRSEYTKWPDKEPEDNIQNMFDRVEKQVEAAQ